MSKTSEKEIIEVLQVFNRVLNEEEIDLISRGYPVILYLYELPNERDKTTLVVSKVRQTSEYLVYVGEIDLLQDFN